MKTISLIILAIVAVLEAGYITYIKTDRKFVKDMPTRWTITLENDEFFRVVIPESETWASLMWFEDELTISSGNESDQAISVDLQNDKMEVITHLKDGGLIKDTNGDGIPECKAVTGEDGRIVLYSSIDTIWEIGKEKCCGEN